MRGVLSEGPITRQLQTERKDVTLVATVKFFERIRVAAPQALNKLVV